MDIRATTQYTQLILEKHRFYSSTSISGSILRNTQASSHLAHAMDAAVVDLVCTVAGKKRLEQTFEYPKTWLDAFKLRWFPKRLLAKYPAQLNRIEVHSLTYFPSIVVPGHAPVVIAMAESNYYIPGE